MRKYIVKVCVMVVLGMNCLQAVNLSASQNKYWLSMAYIILFSFEISCAYLLFVNPKKWIQSTLGWLFVVHGVYPLSMILLSGTDGLNLQNLITILYVLFSVGTALALLSSPLLSRAGFHGRRDRIFPVVFFLSYIPGLLILGKVIESGGPGNEVGLVCGLILLLMTASIVWQKMISFTSHLIALFSVCYIIGYTVVIPPQSFPVFLIFPALFIGLYVGLNMKDKQRRAVGEQ